MYEAPVTEKPDTDNSEACLAKFDRIRDLGRDPESPGRL